MPKKCIVCDKKILLDSRNYQKRLDTFRAAVGQDNIHVCDECIRKSSNAIRRRMIMEAIEKAVAI